MAKVLGESARFVTDKSLSNASRQAALVFLGGYAVALACGVFLGYILANKGHLSPGAIAVIVAAGSSLWASYRIAIKKMGEIENAKISFRKGATGEAIVGHILDNFPDDYVVIHGLTTPHGDLDHVVVGPTGVYIIDAKNWKGVVAADGKGDLLLNGRPTEKPTIKPFLARIMDVREKVETLCAGGAAVRSGLPWFKGVLAFPSARVEARYRETSSVDCMRDEQLWEYIVESRRGKVLDDAQIEDLTRAFVALAAMDRDFSSKVGRRPAE